MELRGEVGDRLALMLFEQHAAHEGPCLYNGTDYTSSSDVPDHPPLSFICSEFKQLSPTVCSY